jgi:hypothetical protein
MMRSRRSEIRRLAVKIQKLTAVKPENDVGLLGLMAGALHALDRAAQLGYTESRGTNPNRDLLADEFRRTLAGIGAKHSKLPRPWRAGFYFLSALYRLASVSDRAHKRFREWKKDAGRTTLEQDVNKIKHEPRAHPELRIKTDFAAALRVAGGLCTGLAERLDS